jgi:hypothetical protein
MELFGRIIAMAQGKSMGSLAALEGADLAQEDHQVIP